MRAQLPGRRGRIVAVLGVIAFLAGLVLGLIHGAPTKLPGVALGWPLLLQAERAAAAAALVTLVAVVFLQLWREGLPSELPLGVKWPDSGTPEVQERILQVERRSTVAFDELRQMVVELARHVPSAQVPTEQLDEAVARWRDDLAQAELKDRVAKAIAKLPEREKLVVGLYYYEELSLTEIAAVLGISASSASRLHRRAVTQLREAVGTDPFPPES